jgi:hypothetical protein
MILSMLLLSLVFNKQTNTTTITPKTTSYISLLTTTSREILVLIVSQAGYVGNTSLIY